MDQVLRKPNVSFYTQGCRLNQSETASLERSFEKERYVQVPFSSPADIVVINTCTVTENGDTDTRRLIHKAVRLNPAAQIALIGCQAQVLKDQLAALPNVKWIIGNGEKMNLARILEEGTPETPMLRTPKLTRAPFTIPFAGIDKKHTRANLKIQDGCDFYCAFCVIPFARGPARSREFDDILKEARELALAGHQELVLTGVNIGTYADQGWTIVDVVAGIMAIPEVRRVRISSIEPTTIPFRLIEWMYPGSKLCPHLHIPIQSGSDSVLKGMSRKYTLREFKDFVEAAHAFNPDICIGTDVIVGFPGETGAVFEETVEALSTLPIHYFHVFSYSERTGTRSLKLEERVSSSEIARRSEILRKLSIQKQQTFLRGFLGQTHEVLVEQEKNGFWHGITDHYIRVKFPVVEADAALKNTFQPVLFKEVKDSHCYAELVSAAVWKIC